MKGPGKLLGYRALHEKIREIHGLKVPRDLVHAMMAEVDPGGLQERAGVGAQKRARKKCICGFQNIANYEVEMKGPGKLLGYRALHEKIREIHGLKVPRDLVHAMMAEVDPAGLQERAGVGARKRARKNAFVSKVVLQIAITEEK